MPPLSRQDRRRSSLGLRPDTAGAWPIIAAGAVALSSQAPRPRRAIGDAHFGEPLTPAPIGDKSAGGIAGAESAEHEEERGHAAPTFVKHRPISILAIAFMGISRVGARSRRRTINRNANRRFRVAGN